MSDSRADELYGLPLSQFIPERDVRVKALRADKKRDAAQALAGRRRPTVAAWAVNQLVRTQSRAIKRLFSAGDKVATAQRRSGSGKAEALREASRGQRDAIDELVQAAEGLLSSDGHPLTAATLERVRETLRAASIDSASRAQVAGGCLTRELHFAGLGIGDLPVTARGAPAQPMTKAQPQAKPDAKAAQRERRAIKEREREAAHARQAALTAARRAETDARRAATRAEKECQAARTHHQEAEGALQAASELLGAATRRAEETGAELTQAERAVRELEHR